MKSSKIDILSISAALLAILFCGYGIGFLIGERTTQKRLSTGVGEELEEMGWVQGTTERLEQELALTAAQRLAVEREIAETAEEIENSRKRAVREYQESLLRLHDRLIPLLDEGQKLKIEESKTSMRILLDWSE